VKPGGPDLSEQHCPATQSVSQKQSCRHPPSTQVDLAEQVSVKIDVVQAPPSAPPPKMHCPVSAVVCDGATSHCCSGLQPVLWTGSHTATVTEQLEVPRPASMSPASTSPADASSPGEAAGPSSPEGNVVDVEVPSVEASTGNDTYS
jgi:hypothetical protein